MTMMTETLVSGTTPVSDNVNLKQHLNTPSEEGQTLRGSVEKALHNYFAHLEGAPSRTCTTWCSPKSRRPCSKA
jgi:Fis family transcriptional regulator